MFATWNKKLVGLFFSLLLTSIYCSVFTQSVYAATSPTLGQADSFAILAGTPNITNVPTSIITGDVGLDPATGAGIGLTCSEVTGTIYDNDGAFVGGGDTSCRVTDAGLLTQAKSDLVTAYDALSSGANATCTTTYAGVKDLVGLSLVPGVYCADAFELSGTLTLSGTGVWIFRSASTLITSGTANVIGGNACSVWWKVTSSATLGTNTALRGNILALTSITMATGASLSGRALARNGAVTLDTNTITAPTCTADLINPPVVTSSSAAASSTSDDEEEEEEAVCIATTPLTPQWAFAVPVEGGVNFTWSAVGGSKVDIEVANANGEYEYRYIQVANTGHMFLPNVSSSQKIRVRVFNECEYGEWLIAMAGPALPATGFTPSNNNISWYSSTRIFEEISSFLRRIHFSK